MVNNQPIGNEARFEAPSLARGEAVELGNLPLKTAENQLFFRLGSEAGKSDPFHVDLIRIICTRRYEVSTIRELETRSAS
jgi:hypothetical protein